MITPYTVNPDAAEYTPDSTHANNMHQGIGQAFTSLKQGEYVHQGPYGPGATANSDSDLDMDGC